VDGLVSSPVVLLMIKA